MKQWRGLWFPDTETHLIEWMKQNQVIVGGRPAYQYAKYERALGLLPADRRRVAVDVGANIGLWSRVMVMDFAEVVAFEPVPAYVECLKLNAPEAKVYELALGATNGFVKLVNTTPGSCGDTRVEGRVPTRLFRLEDIAPTPMLPLDDCRLAEVDLLKIDCEGYEQFVIEGARETILRCKPVVIVEQKPGHASKAYGLDDQGARKLLENLGMKVRAELSGDFIMGW